MTSGVTNIFQNSTFLDSAVTSLNKNQASICDTQALYTHGDPSNVSTCSSLAATPTTNNPKMRLKIIRDVIIEKLCPTRFVGFQFELQTRSRVTDDFIRAPWRLFIPRQFKPRGAIHACFLLPTINFRNPYIISIVFPR